MNDTAVALKAAPEPAKAKRTKSPVYTVLRQIEVDGEKDGLSYLLVAEKVAASSRKAAIVAATEKLEEGLKTGDFLVTPAGSVSQHKRKIRQTTIDDFE